MLDNKPYFHDAGIYFDMPESEYHADDALSTSKMKELKISALSFGDKYRNYNPPERTTTPFMEFGKAIETFLLEPERWDREYIEEVAIPEEALDKVNDLKTWLKDGGHDYKKSGSKPELIDAIMAIDPDVPIVDIIKAEFAAENEGKNIVGIDTMDVLSAMAMKVESKRIFVNGISQVSIFWWEGDVQMKAKLDYLTADKIIDLKTFTNSKRMNIKKLAGQLSGADYLLQAYVNLRGLMTALKIIDDNGYDEGICSKGWRGGYHFLRTVVMASGMEFQLAYIESVRPFNFASKTIQPVEGYWLKQENQFMEFLETYREGMELCGWEKPWDFDEEDTPLLDAEVPAYAFPTAEEIMPSEITASGEKQ